MILFSGRCLKEEEECEGDIGVGGGICYGDGGCGEGMGWMGRLLIPPIYATKQMDLLVLNGSVSLHSLEKSNRYLFSLPPKAK